jgi:thiosulfate/3-mercaptopyruvate sulfurtransferase
MKKVGLYLLLTLVSLALIGCAGHGTSPKGLEIPIEKATLKFASDIKGGGYKIVTTDELKKWYDEGRKMIVISALPLEEDKAFGILPSAINGAIPKTEKELTQTDKDNIVKVAGSDKEKTIVVYCGFVACRRSHMGAKILVDNGYKNVYRYPGGITGWLEMGYPIVK